YEGDLVPVWDNKIKSTYEENTFYPVRANVDDKGNVYILAREYDEPLKAFKFGKPQFNYLMIAYTENGEQENPFDLDLKGRYIVDLSFRVMDDGSIVCGGFYSENYGGGYKGVCFFSADPKTGSITQEGYNEFSAAELSEFMSERRAEKGKEIYNFDLSDLILRDDGGLVMVGEYYNVVVTTRTSNGKTYTTYTYYYNSLLVVSVSPDLSIDWLKVVPKRQVTRNDGGYYSSYAMMVKGENIYVLFNDNDENLNKLSSDDKLKNYDGKRSVVSLVTISSDGSLKKSLLLENKEEGFILRPKICEQATDDDMIIYGELRNKYKVGKLTF
ncbi:MAG: hypothetical protein H7X71_07930, partial [Chitinophagales bacterium]|nr:hypothetical protein [Chitinophagales bacterium]